MSIFQTFVPLSMYHVHKGYIAVGILLLFVMKCSSFNSYYEGFQISR